MYEEDAIREELLGMLEDQGQEMQQEAFMNFESGMQEAKQSRGTFNVLEIFTNMAITDHTDPEQVAFKSKALGLFVRSLKFEDFIKKIFDTPRYVHALTTSLILMKEKGFKTELLMPLIKTRIQSMNLDNEIIINRFSKML